MVMDKLEKQLKKSKQKIRERRAGAKGRGRETLTPEIPTGEEETRTEQVMIESIDYKPMDIDEAIMQMDLANNNFLVFTNSRNDRINVLYRRKDGRLGLIQPSS
jgi:putative sigma-54 modulation protein